MHHYKPPQHKGSGWFWPIVVFGLAILLILWMAGAVEAQDLAPVVPLTESQQWMILVRDIVTLVILPLVGYWLTQSARAKGWEIDQKHTDQLQLAARNAAAFILDPTIPPHQKRTLGLKYMREGATNAIHHHRPTEAKMWEMIQSYMNQIAPPAPPQGVVLGESTELVDGPPPQFLRRGV